VLVGEALHTFQLHYLDGFDENIGEILSHILALAGYCE
jgi:hypothetical protein